MPENGYLDNHISPSVVCVVNHQNIILKYGMRGHFRYTIPLQGFLPLDGIGWWYVEPGGAVGVTISFKGGRRIR